MDQRQLAVATALVLVLSSSASAAAQDPFSPVHSDKHPATARLLVEHSAFTPGKPLTVGLHLKLEKDWHVYWKNPGDSGEPPSLKWDLPEGWTAGPLQFPAPKRLMEGDLVTFGYDKEVLLLALVKPPKEWKDESVTLKATASWLVCKDVCLDGEASLDLTITSGAVSAKLDRETLALFQRTRRALPRTDGVTWKDVITMNAPGTKGRSVRLYAVSQHLPAGAPFFYFPEKEGVVAPSKLAEGTVLKLDAANPPKKAPWLPGILDLREGVHHVAEIPFPLKSPKDFPAGILVVETKIGPLAFRYRGGDPKDKPSGK
ncbi:MAG: protein-disulfide reductase DsbD domain-containing protein [Planctomycetota bacterium]|jgi:thiol:disulfide interchange protein DsbD